MADGTERVGQGLQAAMVAHEDQDPGERGDADRGPHQLPVGERLTSGVDLLTAEVEAIDHRQAETVERDDERHAAPDRRTARRGER